MNFDKGVVDGWKTLNPIGCFGDLSIPTVFGNELSYYEKLCRVVEELDKTLHNVNLLHSEYVFLEGMFNQLKSYVDNYFTNLDVQEEINTKLDEMAASGELYNLFSRFYTRTFSTISDLKTASNLMPGDTVKTLGYYAINDGGGSYYTIGTSGDIELNNGLFANYLITDIMNVLQFGITQNNSGNWQFAIDKTVNSILFVPNGVYNNVSFQIKAGSHIMGQGVDSVILNSTGITGDTSTEYYFINGIIENLTLDGNNTSLIGIDGFIFRGIVRNIIVKNFVNYGIKMRPALNDYQDYVEEGNNRLLSTVSCYNCGTGFYLNEPDLHSENLVAGRCNNGIRIAWGEINKVHVWGYTSNGAKIGGQCILNDVVIEAPIVAHPSNYNIEINASNVQINNLQVFNMRTDRSVIFLNSAENVEINNLLVGNWGNLNPSVSLSQFKLLSGTVENLIVNGIVDDSFTEGDILYNLTATNSVINILSELGNITPVPSLSTAYFYNKIPTVSLENVYTMKANGLCEIYAKTKEEQYSQVKIYLNGNEVVSLYNNTSGQKEITKLIATKRGDIITAKSYSESTYADTVMISILEF